MSITGSDLIDPGNVVGKTEFLYENDTFDVISYGSIRVIRVSGEVSSIDMIQEVCRNFDEYHCNGLEIFSDCFCDFGLSASLSMMPLNRCKYFSITIESDVDGWDFVSMLTGANRINVVLSGMIDNDALKSVAFDVTPIILSGCLRSASIPFVGDFIRITECRSLVFLGAVCAGGSPRGLVVNSGLRGLCVTGYKNIYLIGELSDLILLGLKNVGSVDLQGRLARLRVLRISGGRVNVGVVVDCCRRLSYLLLRNEGRLSGLNGLYNKHEKITVVDENLGGSRRLAGRSTPLDADVAKRRRVKLDIYDL